MPNIKPNGTKKNVLRMQEISAWKRSKYFFTTEKVVGGGLNILISLSFPRDDAKVKDCEVSAASQGFLQNIA